MGKSGDGTLNVQAGGTVSSTFGYVAISEGSTGAATVTGLGSAWTNTASLEVGHFGDAILSVEAGGTVSNTDGYIAPFPGATGSATVTGPGSIWSNSSDLRVGGTNDLPGGMGSLQIHDGGEVAVGNTLTIYHTGSVLLDGGILSVGSIDTANLANLDFVAGTFNLTSDNLTIGAAGLFGDDLNITSQKTINVTNLTTIEAGSDLIVLHGGGFSSGGLTNLGSLTAFDSFSTTGTGLHNLGTAVFIDTIIGGPVNNPTGSNINVIDNVTFTGLVSGGGGIFGSGTADFQGGFAPGDSPALVTVEGSANLGASNTLFMEIGGLLAGTEFDVVDIAGSLTAGGILDIALINAFAPSAGDVFDLLNFGSILGNFSAINLPTLGGNLDWDTSNLLVDGTLSVFSTTLIGDLNGDGFVGLDDLDIILGNWNLNVPPGDPLADVSGPGGVPDGFVGLDDLDVGTWQLERGGHRRMLPPAFLSRRSASSSACFLEQVSREDGVRGGPAVHLPEFR